MRRMIAPFLAASVLAGAASVAFGQGNRAAFEKFRQQHKYTFQLRSTLTDGLMECERSKSTQVKPDQAKKLLDLLTPIRKKPKMTPDEAKATIQKVQHVLDQKQLVAIDKVLQTEEKRRQAGPGGGAPGGGAPGGGAPGGGGPGAGAPGGGAPGGGAPGGAPKRPPFDPAKMKNFNPFNPDSMPDKSSRMYTTAVERNKKLFTFLEARAAGKEAKLDIQRPNFGGGPGGAKGGGKNGAPGKAAPKK